MNILIGKLIYKTARIINRGRSLFYSNKTSVDNLDKKDTEIYKWFNAKRPFGPLPRLCYAPWTNLFFNIEGKAIVCCKNTKVILGEYPTSSIHDIWFNTRIDKLRQRILCNDLSFGCYKCKDSINLQNVSSLTSIIFDKFGMLPLSEYPRVIEFELSNRCNLECVMCSERVSSGIARAKNLHPRTDTIYDQAFIDQLDEFIPHLYEAKFSGGEPFLIPIYYKIWEKIRKLNPKTRIFVQTNGTVLNDEIKNFIKNLHFRINISLDSVNKNNYELIRKNASFEQTMSNIKWFGKHKKHLLILTTPFRQNWKDVPDIISFCNKNRYYFNISPVYHPKELALWSLDIKSQEEIIDYYQSVELPSKHWVERNNKKVFQELINSVLDWKARKAQNENFNDDFLKYMSQQEIEAWKNEKKTVSKEQVQVICNKCIEKLKVTGFTPAELEDVDNIFGEVAKEQFPSVSARTIYLILNEMDAKELLITYRTTATDELRHKISSLFTRLQNEYVFKE